MNPQFLSDPFGPVPEEVILEFPPLKLARVIIGFPTILSIGQQESSLVVAFQEYVRTDYPIYEEQRDSSASLTRIFRSQDGFWEISLNSDSVVLSTIQYKTKEELADRVCKVAEAAKKSFGLNQAAHLGIRFVDRVEDEDIVKNLEKYVDPAFLAPFNNVTWGSDMQLYLTLPDKATLNLRWGLVPPNQVMNNIPLLAHSGISWILCSDMYSHDFIEFDPDKIADTINNYSGRIYTMFRHIFNDDFIRLCGGKT